MAATRMLQRLTLFRGVAAVTTTTASAPAARTFEARSRVATAAHLRSFSAATGGDDGSSKSDDDPKVNGEMNPFERLMQHSQEFRQKMVDGEHSGLHVAGDEEEADLTDKSKKRDSETTSSSDSDNSNSTTTSSSSDDDSDSSSSSSTSSSDSESDDDRSSARRREKRAIHGGRGPTGGVNSRGARTERFIKRQILSAREDELDYVEELSKLTYTRSKERKYQQLLHREQDKDRVCRNCGERGHVAKHCLLPMICSNCGGIGHRQRDCIYPDYSLEYEDYSSGAAAAKKHKSKTISTEIRKLQIRHDKFKDEFDSQIDEYLGESAKLADKRKQRKAEKQRAQEESVDQSFDPVTR